MSLDFGDLPLDVVEVPETIGAPTSPRPNYGPAGTKGICPDCGRELKILKSGDLWAHKCADGQMTTPVQVPLETGPGRTSDPQPKAKKGRAPEKVQVLWVALAASGTEWSAREVVARNTGAPKDIIPVDMGDKADDMLRPILDALWPRLPKGAQKTLVAVADEAGLVLAAMMWGQYIKALNQWQQEYQRTARPQPARPNVTQQNGTGYGVHGTDAGEAAFPGYAPFQPVVADAG